MKYFIPAWYDDQRWWQDTTVPYYQLQNKTEFDDMISLMGMHLENDLDYQLIVLNHAPNLRTFLHRYDLYGQSIRLCLMKFKDSVTMRHKRLIIIT